MFYAEKETEKTWGIFTMIAVYLITHKFLQKHYVGYSKNVKRRFNNHISLLNNNKHHCIHLQRAWNKYGKESFDFHVMQECNSIEQAIEKEMLLLEWTNKIDLYNCTFTNKKEDLIKFALTNEAIQKRKESIKKSERFFSALAINRQKAYTPSSIQKRVSSLKSGGKAGVAVRTPVRAISLKTGEIKLFVSINDAARKLNASAGNIHQCCNGTRNSAVKHTFSYVEATQ